MNCPKCSGGSFLSEEELVKVMDGEPARLLLKAVFTCRSCSERFTRLVWDDLGHHRRVQAGHQPQQGYEQQHSQQQYQQPAPYQSAPAQQGKTEEEAAEGLRFF